MGVGSSYWGNNYNLDGGYGCSPIEQGISVGHTDIYGQHLDGMWVDIPPGTCNGDYWVVLEVDPHDAIIEENVIIANNVQIGGHTHIHPLQI